MNELLSAKYNCELQLIVLPAATLSLGVLRKAARGTGTAQAEQSHSDGGSGGGNGDKVEGKSLQANWDHFLSHTVGRRRKCSPTLNRCHPHPLHAI